MSVAPTRLVLFDIDGTLLWSDGAGRRAMEAALLVVFGTRGPASYRYDGKTDRQIVRELMREEGLPDEAIDARMLDVLTLYLEYLAHELPRASVRAMAGVSELLDAIGRRPHHVPGLLTGNLEPGAARKLEAAGLDFGFFTVGAYGSDHERREELPAIARRRARERLGHDLDGDALVIIGDTPSDVACGRSVGARAIAVATGHYAVAELAACAPAAVFADLSDTDAVLRAIDEA
jgi:phosphoglycolate phosphatase-like HAD superfamily hydrolase